MVENMVQVCSFVLEENTRMVNVEMISTDRDLVSFRNRIHYEFPGCLRIRCLQNV